MAQEDTKIEGPLYLRVRKNGELSKALQALIDAEGFVCDSELISRGGMKRTPYLVRLLPKWFDNVHVKTRRNDGDNTLDVKLSYTNILPGNPESVGTTVPDDERTEPIRWPQAPPLVESMGEVFRTPSWFSVMEGMVKVRRHISLAGPPGVGKDTAVQELAAQEGRVLVTVGGDGGMRKRDLVGTTHISNGSSYFEVAEFAAAVVNGWWVLLTEINAADPDVLMLINACLAPPYIINIQGMAYPVHPDFRLFISYNPGLVGTKPLPQSLKDRFYSIKVPFFEKAQLRNILEAHGMPEDGELWTEMVVDFGIEMQNANKNGSMRYQITVRRLMDAVALVTNDIYNGSTAVKRALRSAVIDAIDSPLEADVAETVLGQVSLRHRAFEPESSSDEEPSEEQFDELDTEEYRETVS